MSTRLVRKPIEQIQVGDSVWAYNEHTRQTALRPVTHLFRYERDTVYVLHTGLTHQKSCTSFLAREGTFDSKTWLLQLVVKRP